MIYHVSVNGSDRAVGTLEAPFRTINHAAQIAAPGDTVQVHEGVYREWVDPRSGGITESSRIVYESAPGERAVIKGSEIVENWEHVEGTVWKKIVANSMFGDWNPFEQIMEGDWMQAPREYNVHLGDVYVNGLSMYEASSLEDLYEAKIRHTCWQHLEAPVPELILHPEHTVYRWYAQVDEENTTIYGNFQEIDPNKVLVEINVRKACFYPKKPAVNYITLRGFEIAHGACPWAPPTSDQVGMVGPHWSHHWIIENNDIHDAKCSAVSLGKDERGGDILTTKFSQKPGHNRQMEAVFTALREGWSKETVGSHIVRNNKIHDCGQTGIVGHMGCAFSTIEHNHIYNIGIKHEYWGDELGGIKLHAPIDVIIKENNIHNCTLGTWLDWQAQGTRVTRNLYYNNNRDFMIEVTHGPCLVDHNIFLSNIALEMMAQGTAFVHNIEAGIVMHRNCLDRATPYHFPHTTQVLGFSFVYGGDDRLINNMFLGTKELPVTHWIPFSTTYDNKKAVFLKSYLEGNAYGGIAKPSSVDKNVIKADGMTAEVEQVDGEWILTLNVPQAMIEASCEPVTTDRLGTPYLTEERYENPDGSDVDFTLDYFGNRRGDTVIPGPFADLKAGVQNLVIWRE